MQLAPLLLQLNKNSKIKLDFSRRQEIRTPTFTKNLTCKKITLWIGIQSVLKVWPRLMVIVLWMHSWQHSPSLWLNRSMVSKTVTPNWLSRSVNKTTSTIVELRNVTTWLIKWILWNFTKKVWWLEMRNWITFFITRHLIAKSTKHYSRNVRLKSILWTVRFSLSNLNLSILEFLRINILMKILTFRTKTWMKDIETAKSLHKSMTSLLGSIPLTTEFVQWEENWMLARAPTPAQLMVTLTYKARLNHWTATLELLLDKMLPSPPNSIHSCKLMKPLDCNLTASLECLRSEPWTKRRS